MLSNFLKNEKVYVFIDAENLFYSQKTLGWLISYDKLMKYFKEECGENTKYIELKKLKNRLSK